MSIKQIRLSSQAKEKLMRLKTRTGIQQWNILCRWAFCLSLKEPTPPTPIDIPADSNVEMSWHVFGGDCHELYMSVLKERCDRDGLEINPRDIKSPISAPSTSRDWISGNTQQNSLNRGPCCYSCRRDRRKRLKNPRKPS